MRTLTGVVAMLFALLMAGSPRAEQNVLEVIALRHRPADQIVPVLRPLVAPGGMVTGMNDQLIIRTTPANLKELKQVLARIDVRPRRLIISVRQDADVDRSGGGAGVTVRGGEARARVYSSEGQRGARISQQVQVVEGGQAFIRIGESTPVHTQQWVDTPYGPRPVEADAYRDTDRGFMVVPHVIGDEVTLELSGAADMLTSRTSGASALQRVHTTVSGRLDEWIEVAGIGEEALGRDDEILASSRDARREARRVLLKVDEIK